MTIGGYNVTKHLPKEIIQYIPYKKNYHILIKNIVLYDDKASNEKKTQFKNKKMLKKDFKAIVDSSSSKTYLPQEVFDSLKNQFNGYCSKINTRCVQKPNFDENYCVIYDQSKIKNLTKFFMSFPNLYVKFNNGAILVWSP